MALQDGEGGGDVLGREVGLGGEGEEQRFVAGQVRKHGRQKLGRTGIGAHLIELHAGQRQKAGETLRLAGQEAEGLGTNGFRRLAVDQSRGLSTSLTFPHGIRLSDIILNSCLGLLHQSRCLGRIELVQEYAGREQACRG